MPKTLLLLSLALAPFGAYAASPVVVNCNHGALRILQKGPDAYRIIVADPHAVDYVIEQSRRTIQVRDSGGRMITTVASLPRVAKIANGPRPAFVIDEIRYQPVSGGYAAAGGAVYFKPFARGADLTFSNEKMTSSHTYARWQVANWWFDSCEYR